MEMYVFERLEAGPEELMQQLPFRGELVGSMMGTNKREYWLLRLPKPVAFRLPDDLPENRLTKGGFQRSQTDPHVALVDVVAVAPRLAGEKVTPAPEGLLVDVFYVLHEDQLSATALDIDKIHPAGLVHLRQARDESGGAASDPETGEPLDPAELASLLNQISVLTYSGIANRRNSAVEDVEVELTFDELQRVSTCRGVADGTPAIPTQETFERINEVTARLLEFPRQERFAKLKVTIADQKSSYDISYRNQPS